MLFFWEDAFSMRLSTPENPKVTGIMNPATRDLFYQIYA